MEYVEKGAWLQHRLSFPPPSHFIFEDEAEESQRQCETEQKEAIRALEVLASRVRGAHPEVYDTSGSFIINTRSVEETSENALACLEDLCKVLYEEEGLKGEQSEFLYTGFSHVLLPGVLENRRGVPLGLSVLVLSLARRLGLPVSGVPAFLSPVEPKNTIRSLAREISTVAPSAPPCILRVELPSQASVYFDPFNKGAKLTEDECRNIAAMSGLGEEGVAKTASPAQWYAAMARVMVQVHQRRGESDYVAHWVYQLLAIDPHAPEWTEMSI
eukprot:CAMPEP_0196592578 /NCGR_PEP_ID=MMETSP1081-20130531/73110_1 /TAXON_ID=36882 /ORGANISM="Pyramimonas amylifera, Strain CCMP720" /LENGTH=271 /DNA_ID=CAMNT_0041916311 /DNA_START=410 /DNA_END=1225 /DNA_ORIENTATION=+